MPRLHSERRVAQVAFLGLMLVVFVFGWESLARGQAEPTEKTVAKPGFRYEVTWVSSGGAYTYTPGRWGELRLVLVNAWDEPRELLCSTYFDTDPTMQFGRRVWLPPQSTLRITHPILIPKGDPAKGRALNLHSLVLDATSASEVLVKNDQGQLLHEGVLLVSPGGRNTGIIDEASIRPGVPPSEVVELIAASRVAQQMSNKSTYLLDPFLPADETSLNAMDHLIVVDDRIVEDLAALTALRHWLHSGGHLWLMLDHLGPHVLEKLFGDDFSGHIVDRVSLTSVRIDKAATKANPDGSPGEVVEYDEPVDFVRMVVSDVEVTHLVNGWPAAMTKQCGDGKLLITTIGAHAWMKVRPANSQQSSDPTMNSFYVPIAPMSDLAADFYGTREPELLTPGTLEPQVREYIGYSIPSWSLILGTLLGFSVSLVAIGFLLLRVGRLEHLGWIGSALAIAVSMLLFMVGRANRHGIPATLASVQIVQSIPGTDDLQTSGVLAVYQPEGSEFPIETTRGGRMMPDMAGFEGTSRRLITTDLGVSHWENMRQPAGLRSTSFQRAESVVDRLEAHATFNNQGITGHYSGRVPPGTDPMIATRNGRMSLILKHDGTFVGRPNDVFEKDQFLGAGLLSDEQHRRRQTLEKLLTNEKRRDYPERPQLMFWTEPMDNGFHFSEGLKNQGASLIALPLIFERPSNGTDMLIPSPLLGYVNRRNPDGSPPSTMWNHGRKEWEKRSSPGSTWLSFQIPRELLPLTARRALVELKVSGPIGKIEILGLKNGVVTSLQTVLDPVGSITIDITEAEGLKIDDEGRLALGLNAGDPLRPELTNAGPATTSASTQHAAQGKNELIAKVNYWQIESLALQLWAKTIEPTAND